MVAVALARPAALGLSGAPLPAPTGPARVPTSSGSVNVTARANVACARKRAAASGEEGGPITIAVGIALPAGTTSVSAVPHRVRTIRAPPYRNRSLEEGAGRL